MADEVDMTADRDEREAPVVDVRFCDTARYCHYVDFKNIQKVHKNG